MKRNKILPILLSTAMVFGLTACESTEPIVYEGDVVEGLITDETSSLGIDSDSTDFESLLEDGQYYIVHNGVYYPVFTDMTNEVYDDFELKDANQSRNKEMMFYTLESEQNIPTLFPGDTIVYYSTDNMLQDIFFERYYDCGITFGLRDLQRTVGGKYYIDLENSDIASVLPNTSLSEIDTYDVPQVLIDKVGGIEVGDASVKDGIIMGATKGQSYDFEVYTGTNYKYLTGEANIHAFKDFELYESTNFTTLREHFWQITVPDYLVEGYYNINHMGMFRLCKDIFYSDSTNYNEQLIYPALKNYPYDEYESYTINDYYDYLMTIEDKYYDSTIKCSLYTEDEELLNGEDGYKYQTTNIAGCINYVEPKDPFDSDYDVSEQVIYEEEEIARLTKSNIIRYELWFPENKKCKVQIETEEGTGAAYIKFSNGSTNQLTYNKFDKVYETEFTGVGIEGIITISGLTNDYDIVLTNVDLYDNQDAGQVSDTEQPEEPAEESEE